jgi:uncharacterized protein
MAAILDDILSSLTDDAPVQEIRIGPRSSMVRGQEVGLAYLHRAEPGTSPWPAPRWPEISSLRELAYLARSAHPVDASVGVAAINAIARPAAELLEEGDGLQLILEHGRGRDVTLVGHFPFVDRLRKYVRNLWVLELHPGEGDLPASEASRVIPRSDVVAITGSTLINHTLEDLLVLASGRPVILLGPSTILSPVLFDHGISAACGAVVQDVEEVRRCISAGMGFRFATGIRKVIWRRASPPSGFKHIP